MSNITDGIELLKSKIKPAAFSETTENALKMASYLQLKGYSIGAMQAQEICDVLYKGLSTDLLSQISWTVKPAKLTRTAGEGKSQGTTAIEIEESNRQKRLKEEAVKKHEAEQADALRQCQQIIQKFSYVSGGQVMYGRTSEARKNGMAHLEKAQKNGRDLRVVAEELIKYYDDIWDAQERADVGSQNRGVR